MALNEIYRQDKSGTEHGAAIDGIRLLTPTYPQWTRNDLERDLLIQVAFSRHVSDAITRPILKEGDLAFVPSLMFDLFPDLPGRPTRYVVEVAASARKPSRATTDAARKWCAANDTAYRIIDAHVIRTAYLTNARLLTPYVGDWPHDDDVDAVSDALKTSPNGTVTVKAAEEAIRAAGVDAVFAEHAVRQIVANWFLDCDLTRAYGPDTVLTSMTPNDYDGDKDPILRLIRAAGDDPGTGV